MKLKINASALESAIRQTCAGMRARPFIEQEVFVIAEQNGMQVQVVITRDEDSFIEEVSGEFTVPDKPQCADCAELVDSITPEILDWTICGMAVNGRTKEKWAMDIFGRFDKAAKAAKAGLQRPAAPEGE